MSKVEEKNEVRLKIPTTEDTVRSLKIRDAVYVSGTIYTARDKVHNRLLDLAMKDQKPPFNLDGGALWHCGPITKKIDDKWSIVVAGPTSSLRMSTAIPKVLEKFHPRVMIGKGNLRRNVLESMRRHGAVFVAGVGGAAAYYSQQIKSVQKVYWTEFGMPEAVWELQVEDLGPFIVSMDTHGNDLDAKLLSKINRNITETYRKFDIDPKLDYVMWPTLIAGRKEASESFVC